MLVLFNTFNQTIIRTPLNLALVLVLVWAIPSLLWNGVSNASVGAKLSMLELWPQIKEIVAWLALEILLNSVVLQTG